MPWTATRKPEKPRETMQIASQSRVMPAGSPSRIAGAGEVFGAVAAAVLLVGGEDETQRSGGAAGDGLEGGAGQDHCGDRALHVGRTQPVEPVAADRRREGVGLPLARRLADDLIIGPSF